MRLLFLAAGSAGVALAQPALAQTSKQTTPQQHQTAQDPAQLRRSIQHDLEQAVYTDIQIAPEAFLVHARDKQGQLVTMMIEPGAVSAVTKSRQQRGTGGDPATLRGAAGRRRGPRRAGDRQIRSSRSPGMTRGGQHSEPVT